MIEWTVLGSGTHVASERRGSPAHLASVGGAHLLIDCGAGSFHGLRRAGSGPEEIAACLVTHLHPDHVSDLVPLLFRLRNIAKENDEKRTFRLVGPSGFASFIRSLEGLHAPFLTTPNLEIEVLEAEEGEEEIAGVSVRFAPAAHGIAALSYSIASADGSRIVYSGDTGRSAGLVRLARGAALLVVEASFPNDIVQPFHLTPAGAAAIAAEAGVKGMVLVHLNPECDEIDLIAECGDAFQGKIVVAEDLLELVVENGEIR